LSVERMDPNALVAVLPSGHYYSNESAVSAAMEEAFDIAAQRPDLVILLGARPSGPEVEYDWIEPGNPTGYGRSLQVRTFHEKPAVDVARNLFRRGAFWNTLIMVGHVCAFLDMIRTALPDLISGVPENSLWAGAEIQIPEAIYDRIPRLSFSHDVLSRQSGQLIMLPVQHAGWSDMSCPRQVNAVLNSMCH